MSESSDKRSVHTDALATLGTIIDENTGGRDAIHLAVIPVEAKEKLMPGWDVTADGRSPDSINERVGIVDPFLRKAVKPGEWFWLILYPRTITSLRHVWAHPAFPAEADLEHAEKLSKRLSGTDKQEAEEWLREFCSSGSDRPSFEAVMASVNHYDGDEYFTIDGETCSGDIPVEFWERLETLTGRRFPSRAGYFSCAC